jgi:PAS domain S-box-containing protein
MPSLVPKAVRWPRLSLRWRLVLLVVLALLPALLFFVQHVQEERAALIAAAEARALRLARAWAQNHDALVREAQLVLEAAERDPTLVHAAPAGCAASLTRLVADTRWSSAVEIVDRNGIVLCASQSGGKPLLPPTAFLDDLFADRGPEVSEFVLDAGGWSVAFAGRLLPGAPSRAVVALIDLAEIQRRTAIEAAGAQYNIMVIGRTGLILARDPEAPGFVGTPIGSAHPLMPDLMVKTEGTAFGRGRDGVDRIFAFTQLPATGAKISVGLAREDVLGAQERSADRQLMLLAAVAVAALAGAWLVSEFSLVRWVRALRRAADGYARGELARRIEITPTAGEFAALGEAFNRMAATIEARTAALAASEHRFRDIADVAGDFFWERDAEGRFTFLSDRFTEVTGLAAAEIIGRCAEDLVGPVPGAGSDVSRLLSALARRQPFHNLTLAIMPGRGESRWWRVSGRPFFDPATGAFLGFRGAGSEVTEAMQAEQELRCAKEAAEAANIAKSEFLATMSHELRTPLNAVIGFSEIMHNELLGPIGIDTYRQYAGDIMQSGMHLLGMINDILDFAKIDAGRLHLSETEVDLVSVAERAVRAVAPQAQAAGVMVSVAPATSSPIAWGDERRLMQVLLNLVSNAVKFTPRGGSVELRLGRTAEGGVEVSVRDTGIGIAAEDLPRVIEPFRQVDSGHARRHEGTGLGLAICDRLVRLHGGTLSLASTVGQGTVATVTLPAARSLPARFGEAAIMRLQAGSRTASP